MKAYERYTSERGGNGSLRHASVSEIERDVSQIRREMSKTIEAIEAKLSPGGVIDQVLAQLRGAGEGGGEFFRNLGDTVKTNPVPVVMIATGLGALLVSSSEVGSALGARLRGMGEEAEEAGEERVKPAIGGRARQARESAEERMHDVQERMQTAQSRARARADRAREEARKAQARSRHMMEEQPLVLVGLGLALGAAIAGAKPVTERERSLRRSIQGEGEGLGGTKAVTPREPGVEAVPAVSREPSLEPNVEPLVEPSEPLIRPDELPRTD